MKHRHERKHKNKKKEKKRIRHFETKLPLSHYPSSKINPFCHRHFCSTSFTGRGWFPFLPANGCSYPFALLQPAQICVGLLLGNDLVHISLQLLHLAVQFLQRGGIQKFQTGFQFADCVLGRRGGKCIGSGVPTAELMESQTNSPSKRVLLPSTLLQKNTCCKHKIKKIQQIYKKSDIFIFLSYITTVPT